MMGFTLSMHRGRQWYKGLHLFSTRCVKRRDNNNIVNPNTIDYVVLILGVVYARGY